MKPRNFFAELQRRHVYKVGAAYAVAGWLLVQVVTQVFPIFEVSVLAQRIIVLVIVAGFPITLILAWLFDITSEGIVRTGALPASGEAPAVRRERLGIDRKLNYVLGALLLVAVAYLAAERVGLINGSRKVSTVATGIVEKSIAVLPFENRSEDKANAYFADGIQDEILTRLAKIADLRVISRTSTQHFKSTPDNLPQIAKQLGVAHILEGSVQKAADRVRVNVQLIKAANDSHLWADTFDRKLDDIFAVESEIATTIADKLRAKLTGSEAQAIGSRPTENSAAHELYLRGLYFWNKRNATDLEKALTCFQQAVTQDPNYALAWSGISQVHILLPIYGGAAPVDA